METVKAKLFTTSFSTLTRKTLAVFGLLIAVSGATLILSPQTAHAYTYTYTDNLGFGTDVDGNVWNIWSANGSNVWDWNQDYVGGYLHYAFKVLDYSGYYCSGSCRYHNVWDKDPSTGFETWDELGHDSGTFPENNQNNHKYQVDVQWNATGYHVSVYDITASSEYSDNDYTYSVDANTYDSWTWGYSYWTSGAYTDEDASTHASNWTGTIYQDGATGTTGGGGDVRTTALPVMGGSGGGGSPPSCDGVSCIASTTPADLQNTATSTSYYFGTQGTIEASDIGSNMNVTMQYYNDTLAQAAVSPSVVTKYITFPLTASTTENFSFSTTTDMSDAPLGRYYLTTTINKDEFSLFGFSFWSTAIARKVTTFYVSTTTAHIYVTGYDSLVDLSNPANITAIEAGITTCDFSWGDLASTTKISSFLTCLVVPDSSSLAITFNQFQQNVLTLAPWGYITRFVNILASTTPVEPPPLTYRFGSSSPAVLQAYTASDPITFQVFDYMGSSSPLLQIKADDGSNKNVWDIIDPFVTFLVTVGVLLVILGDIMGFSMPSGESENERMKKIDYSKMSDREFKKRVKIEYVTEEEQRMQRRNRL
ncbi:MAG: hypothetical protein ACYC75_01855 [Minisyncoccota bacterium]